MRKKLSKKQLLNHNLDKSTPGFLSNLSVIIVCSMFFCLFLYMIGYFCHFIMTNEQDMVNNSYNSRQQILLSRNYRGTIFASGGEILAETVVDVEQNETRVYPYKNLFSHVVGYSVNGRMGVEALANYYLINTNTSLENKVKNDMAGLKNPGNNVYTTLDVAMQELADKELNIYKGAIIITEVKTGRILAMVSHPDFDPNTIEENWDNYLASTTSSVLLNRATQGVYPPGSTFKIITSLEYIRENPDTYQTYRYHCNGSYSNGDRKISCFHQAVHGDLDFDKSFAKSCNASYTNIGMQLDRERFRDTLEELLFFRDLPVTLQYSKSSTDVDSYTPDDEMMQVSIGQGKTEITPIHLNMITCAIANGGVLMKPYLIDRVENDTGNIVKRFAPETYGALMTKKEAEILTRMLQGVVQNGTASKLKGKTYTAAGKTGSAEYGTVKGDSHAWFTGFAPVEDPEICVTIIVEGAGSGGDYAVPIAASLFDRYFQQK